MDNYLIYRTNFSELRLSNCCVGFKKKSINLSGVSKSTAVSIIIIFTWRDQLGLGHDRITWQSVFGCNWSRTDLELITYFVFHLHENITTRKYHIVYKYSKYANFDPSEITHFPKLVAIYRRENR